MITGAQHIAVDTLETTWIQVLADDRQRNLLAAVRVCTNDKSDALLVDLPAFQLMGCQRVVVLEMLTEANFIHVEHVLLCLRINNNGCPVVPRQLLPCPMRRFPQNGKMT